MRLNAGCAGNSRFIGDRPIENAKAGKWIAVFKTAGQIRLKACIRHALKFGIREDSQNFTFRDISR